MKNMKIKEAALFAKKAHGNQKYGTSSYTKHLREVYDTLIRFGYKEEDLLCAAWLHDVVEDTDTSIVLIALTFGQNVADIVYAVTNEPGKNRKERHLKTYPKIKNFPEATALKLADRIANVEASLKDNPGLLQMYKKEHSFFKASIQVPNCATNLWDHLDYLLGL